MSKHVLMHSLEYCQNTNKNLRTLKYKLTAFFANVTKDGLEGNDAREEHVHTITLLKK